MISRPHVQDVQGTTNEIYGFVQHGDDFQLPNFTKVMVGLFSMVMFPAHVKARHGKSHVSPFKGQVFAAGLRILLLLVHQDLLPIGKSGEATARIALFVRNETSKPNIQN